MTRRFAPHDVDDAVRARSDRAPRHAEPAPPGWLASDHVGTLPVEALLPHRVAASLDRAAQLALAAQLDARDGADNSGIILAIAEAEALRVYLEPLRGLTVALYREPRSVPVGAQRGVVAIALGVELPLDAAGQVSLASLDRVAAEPFAVVFDRATAAAHQLVEIEKVALRARTLDGDVSFQLADIEAHPERYPLRLAEILREHIHGIRARSSHLLETLVAMNDDQRFRMMAIAGHAIEVQRAARTAHFSAKSFHQRTLPGWYPGESYMDYEDQMLEEGGLGYVGFGATKAFHVVGNTLTAGDLDRGGANARAYRRGEISWNAFKHRESTNFIVGTVEAIVTAVTLGRGSGLVVGAVERLGLAESSAASRALLAQFTYRATTGAGVGAITGAAVSAANDAVTLIASYASDDPFIRSYQRGLVGGPQAWATSAFYGGLAGGVLGGASAFLPRSVPAPFNAVDDWYGASLADPAPLHSTLPVPVANRLAPVSEALARGDLVTAVRTLDTIAALDGLPPPLVQRLEVELTTAHGLLPTALTELRARLAMPEPPLSAYAVPWEDPSPPERHKAGKELAANPHTIYHHDITKGGTRAIVESGSMIAGWGTAAGGGQAQVRAWFGPARGATRSTPTIEFQTLTAADTRSYAGGTVGAVWRIGSLEIQIRRILLPDGRIAVPDGAGRLTMTYPDGRVEIVSTAMLPD